MQGMGLRAGLSALAFWGFIAAVVVAGIWYDVRKREAQHETLRRLIESGQPIDQVVIDRLLSVIGGNNRNLDRDLKVAGVITLSSAPGFALMGWFIGFASPGVFEPLLGVGSLAACAGIGLLVASKIVIRWNREHRESDSDMSGA